MLTIQCIHTLIQSHDINGVNKYKKYIKRILQRLMGTRTNNTIQSHYINDANNINVSGYSHMSSKLVLIHATHQSFGGVRPGNG